MLRRVTSFLDLSPRNNVPFIFPIHVLQVENFGLCPFQEMRCIYDEVTVLNNNVCMLFTGWLPAYCSSKWLSPATAAVLPATACEWKLSATVCLSADWTRWLWPASSPDTVVLRGLNDFVLFYQPRNIATHWFRCFILLCTFCMWVYTLTLCNCAAHIIHVFNCLMTRTWYESWQVLCILKSFGKLWSVPFWSVGGLASRVLCSVQTQGYGHPLEVRVSLCVACLSVF